MAEHLSARQRRPSMARRKKRRIGAFSKRLTFSDLDGRTNAGKYVNAIKHALEAQIGNPSAGQQILIKLVAVKMLRCEMMYERVLSQPDGGDLQDRVENYFLAWSNSVRRDLEALGVLESSRSAIDELLKIAPRDMTDEQLEIARAFCKRQLALWDHNNTIGNKIKPVAIGVQIADFGMDAGQKASPTARMHEPEAPEVGG